MERQRELEKLLATAEPPELGPVARAGVQTEAALQRQLEDILARSQIPEERRQLIRALILLWHGQLSSARAWTDYRPDEHGDQRRVQRLVD